MQMISAQQIQSGLDWAGVLDAMHKTHLDQCPLGGSNFVGDANYGLFSRGVILPGAGAGLKLASIYPANSLASPFLPTEQAAFLVIDETTLLPPSWMGWKSHVGRPQPTPSWLHENSPGRTAGGCCLGAGPVVSTLIDADLHIRPSIQGVSPTLPTGQSEAASDTR